MDYKDTTHEMWSVFMDRAIALLDKGYVTLKQVEPYRSKFLLCDKDWPKDSAAEIASTVESVVAACVASRKYRHELFDVSETNITPSHLYEYTYEAFNNWLLPQLLPVFDSGFKLIKSISLKRAVKKAQDSTNIYFTEWDVVELLLAVDFQKACWLIDQLNATPKQKGLIKQHILKNEADKIVDLLISESIDTTTLQDLLLLLKMQLKLPMNLPDMGPEALSETIDSYLEDEHIDLDADEYDSLNQISIANSGEYYILPSTIAANITTDFEKSVCGIRAIKHLCSDVKSVREVESLVESCPLKISTQNLDDIVPSKYMIPILEDFLEYIDWSDLQVPSTNDRKKNSDYYTGRIWDEGKIFELYKLLVTAGLLERSQEAAVSFLYRFCNQYAQDINAIRPIRWLGDKRSELVYLIYYFHGDDGRKNKKMCEFFIDRQGEHFKQTTGDKHYFESAPPTERIAMIIKNPLFQY